MAVLLLYSPAQASNPNVGVIDDFDAGVGNWWPPAHSGSLSGVLRDEQDRPMAWRAHDRTVTPPGSGSAGSLRLAFRWDAAIRFMEPASGGAASHLVRLHMPPDRANLPERRFGPGQAIEVFVHGDGSDNRFRLMIRDGRAQLEGSPWFTVDWNGWRRIVWDLARDPVHGWVNGNGVLDGHVFHFDSILVTRDERGSTSGGTLHFDGLRIVGASADSREDRPSTPARSGVRVEDAPDSGSILPQRWRRGREQAGRF